MNSNQQYIKLLRVFISSPDDVAEERALVKAVLDRVNQSEGEVTNLRFEAFDWKTNVVPKVGGDPQKVADEQTPDYDIYIGILGMKFGTPTKDFGSGTEAEFNEALSRYNAEGKPWILFYFKTLSSAPSNTDEGNEFLKVLSFKDKVEKIGIVGKFTTLRGSDESFFERLEHDLRLLAHKFYDAKQAELKLKAAAQASPVSPRKISTEKKKENKQFFVDKGQTDVELRNRLVSMAQAQLFDVITVEICSNNPKNTDAIKHKKAQVVDL